MLDLIHFGKIVATHGVEGAIVIQHALKKKTQLPKVNVLFIEILKEQPSPYFIKNASAKSDTEIILHLEDFTTKEAAKVLLNKKVWLPKDVFDGLVDKNAPVALLGYTIIEGNTSYGTILEVLEQPHQILCRLMYKNKEVLIPLHQETLKGIDRNKQIIEVTLPEGLLDVYLS
jgi:16S rRNA processing protein RimM